MTERADNDAPVLVCYDGSTDAARAVDAAASLLPGRRAVVLTVAPAMTLAEGMAATSSLVPGTVFEDLNSAGALRLAEAGAGRARRAGLHAEARTALAPSVWEGIVDVADELNATVIVIGSRGLKGLRQLAGGSVSHQVSMRARRPVLIVPPAKAG